MNFDSYIYSISGRNTGKKFDIILNKQNERNKKYKSIRDDITLDPEWNDTSDNHMDYIDLFQENQKDKKFKSLKNENNSIKNKIKIK